MRKKLKIIILILLLLGIGLISFKYYSDRKYASELEKAKILEEKEKKIKEIKSHYGKTVKVLNDASIYKKDSKNYLEIGKIYKDNLLALADIKIDENTEYFYSNELDLYIKYDDVSPTEETFNKNDRYKKYIPFNENFVTKASYTIYDSEGVKKITFNSNDEYPIIIKSDNGYYFEFDDELAYINKTDVEKIIENKNTESVSVSSVPVLNYHFIYDPAKQKCNQRICMTTDLYEKHIKYLKANYLDLTMKEFDYFMNDQIRLPKSVLVTHDDGWLRKNAVEILDRNEFHATFFLVTSWYKPIESKYVEYHSHTNDMHNVGACPGGQGGGIKCLSEAKIQADLKESRDILNGTTYFCYPFYEYNNYAINQLKKAGFTLAFVGGNKNATPKNNHFLIPRYPIYNWMTVDHLKKMF